MKFKTSILFILTLSFFSLNAYAAQGTITGTVKYLRTHQYLDNTPWDKVSWFCLNSSTTVGSCPVLNYECGGSTLIVIAEEAQSEVFSLVLAAQMSGKELSVMVDDNKKVNGNCQAYWIDLKS